MTDVTVISSDKDGAELRRIKARNPYHVRATGTRDEGVINDAIDGSESRVFLGLGEAWERIFGEKK